MSNIWPNSNWKRIDCMGLWAMLSWVWSTAIAHWLLMNFDYLARYLFVLVLPSSFEYRLIICDFSSFFLFQQEPPTMRPNIILTCERVCILFQLHTIHFLSPLSVSTNKNNRQPFQVHIISLEVLTRWRPSNEVVKNSDWIKLKKPSVKRFAPQPSLRALPATTMCTAIIAERNPVI